MVFVQKPTTEKPFDGHDGEKQFGVNLSFRHLMKQVKKQADGIKSEHKPQRACADRGLPGDENFSDVPIDVLPCVVDVGNGVHDHHRGRFREQSEIINDRVDGKKEERKIEVWN